MTLAYKTREQFEDAQLRGTTRKYTVGVDLGQTTDPTAIAVIEREEIPGGRLRGVGQILGTKKLVLRHLERLPLGKSYVDQVGYVNSLMSRPPLSMPPVADLVIDQTGVGRAVFDLFKATGLSPKGVTITGGEAIGYSNGGYRVPKAVLVSLLQARLHSGDLEIAGDLPDLPALKAELQNFRVGFTGAGHMTFNARVGTHDDLVLAVAIALWFAETRGGSSGGYAGSF